MKNIKNIIVNIKIICLNFAIFLLKIFRSKRFLYDEELIHELKNDFLNIPIMRFVDAAPSEKNWLNNANALRSMVLSKNPKNFLNWDVIAGTMFVTYTKNIKKELNYLRSLSDWSSKWRLVINESLAGDPAPYIFYPKSSANLIHQAYHLAKFEDEIKARIDKFDYIFEFGGGYGCMCRLIHELGFKGKYVIFDLVNFSALQNFYLKANGLKVYNSEFFEQNNDGIICVSDFDKLKCLISSGDGAKKLFIGTWSISESPLIIRNLILPLITDFNFFLIAYQRQFCEMDNRIFFNDWKNKLGKNFFWYHEKIETLSNNYYLFGEVKRS